MKTGLAFKKDFDMTKDEQINNFATELCEICRSRHKCATEGPCTMAYIVAEGLHDVDYRKQIEAEWIPIDRYLENFKCWAVIGYTCSNCKTEVQEYTNYCAYCGARMEVRDKL